MKTPKFTAEERRKIKGLKRFIKNARVRVMMVSGMGQDRVLSATTNGFYIVTNHRKDVLKTKNFTKAYTLYNNL